MIHDVSLKNRSDERELMLEGESEEARVVLRELIYIIRKSRIASKKFKRPMQFQTTFDADRAAKVRELKQLLGVSSMQSVVERCIDLVYDQRTPLKRT